MFVLARQPSTVWGLCWCIFFLILVGDPSPKKGNGRRAPKTWLGDLTSKSNLWRASRLPSDSQARKERCAFSGSTGPAQTGSLGLGLEKRRRVEGQAISDPCGKKGTRFGVEFPSFKELRERIGETSFGVRFPPVSVQKAPKAKRWCLSKSIFQTTGH